MSVVLRADELPVLHLDATADRDDIRAADNRPVFEGRVIDVHLLRFCGDNATRVWIEHDEIGVRTDLNRAFLWK